ncbi:MAG: ribonuclease HI family protein [bacterium]
MEELTIYVDGASAGNPGKAGIGIVLFCKGKKIKEYSQYIGVTTNNVAEYMAVIFAMQEALIMRVQNITIFTDSELITRQIQGVYKVKDNNLFRLYKQVQHLENGFTKFNITYIERSGNKEADKLASKSLEMHK